MRPFPRSVFLPFIFIAGCGIDPGPSDEGESATVANGQTQSEHPREHHRYHCVLPWGIDWNRVFHLHDAAIVIPACPEIHPGDRYVPLFFWTTNTKEGIEGQPVVYPDGYVPARAAPVHDFLHKLVKARYVVQPGGQEYVFRAREIEDVVTLGDLGRGSEFVTPAEYPEPAVALLGKLPPLPLGTYSTEIHVTMSDTHCDGLGTDFDSHCLPPGETFLFPQDFSVVP
jgi:hypothetical protein